MLNRFFVQSIQDAAVIDPSYERLWKSLYTLIQSGGKRLRPQMTLLAYTAFGGKDLEAIAPVAAAQELLHFSLLIHDDIIDRDYIRYGVANIAGQYKLTYSQFVASKNDITHYSHSAAILAGDLMLSGAHQLIATSNLPGDAISTAQHLMGRGIFEVAGGELLDTELSFMPYKDGDALKIATYKTASYSFIAPLLIGARLAGASDDASQTLKEYATALGVAYQLTDDILGVFGVEAETGKSTTGDILEGKRTYLVEMALKNFSTTDNVMFMRAFGNADATTLELEAAKQLLVTSGARQQTEEKIAHYTAIARRSLDTLSLPTKHHDKFLQMVDKVIKRSS